MNSIHFAKSLTDVWEVLLLFIIPIGGGIPAGVILAKARSISWITTAWIYFFSDVLLACVFEPLIILFLYWSAKTHHFIHFRRAFAEVMQKTTARYGINPSPWTLVMITFGTDPMTGRSISKAAGHGFFTGWALTIAGDMIFFFVIMASTLWLNNILGDGTWTAIIITVAMIGIPTLYQKWKEKRTPAN